MSNCDQIQERLAEVPGPKEARQDPELAAHLDACGACREVFTLLFELEQGARGAEPPEIDTAAHQATLRAMHAAAGRRRPSRFFLGLAALGAAAAAVLLLLRPEPRLELSPQAVLVRGGVEAPGAGTTLATSNEVVRYRLHDSVEVTLGPDTSVRLEPARGPLLTLALERGKLVASFEPSEELQRLRVETERTVVEVAGTIFAVERGAAEDVVAVRRGGVRVSEGLGEAAFVTAGSAVRIGSGGVTRSYDEAGLHDWMAAEAAADWRAVRCPCGWVQVTARDLSVNVAGVEVGTSPLAFRWSVGPATVALRAGDAVHTENIAVRDGQVETVRWGPTSGAATAPEPPAVVTPSAGATPRGTPEAPPEAPPPTAAELYAQAEKLLAAGRLDEALALLRRVSEEYPNDALAAVAHYERAVALRDKRHDPAAARRAFGDYLALLPSGPLWREARLAECQLGDDAEACFLALAAAPGADWAGMEAKLELAKRSEQRGAYAEAEKRYAELVKLPSAGERVVEDAWMGRARALSGAGKRGEARQLLMEYLERFPSGRYEREVKERLAGRP